MKKLGLLFSILVMFFAFTQTVNAQCTPDPLYADSVAGLYPASLPDATVGEPYNEVVQIVIPQDTTVEIPSFPPVNIAFCSFELTGLPNLPDGLAYECDTDSCVWIVDQDSGAMNLGCVVISGTPTEEFSDTNGVIVEVDIQIPNPDCTTPQPVSQLPIPIDLPVFSVDFTVLPAANAIDDLTKENMSLKIYPNPTSFNSTLSFNLSEKVNNASIQIYDMYGKVVQDVHSGLLTTGNYEFDIKNTGMSKGIYFVKLDFDNGTKAFTEKLIVK